MNLMTIRYSTGRSPLTGYVYHATWILDVGWNRIKINLTQWRDGRGFVTWYPFSLYWWPPHNQWFRWRILGPKIRFSPGDPM